MNNPHRNSQIRRAFLKVLKNAGDFALEESIAWSHVDDVAPPPTTAEEREDTMKFFTEGKYIAEAEGSLDPKLKQWVITQRGRGLLASL